MKIAIVIISSNSSSSRSGSGSSSSSISSSCGGSRSHNVNVIKKGSQWSMSINRMESLLRVYISKPLNPPYGQKPNISLHLNP